MRAGLIFSLAVISCCVEIYGATFGNVVVIGGHASDLALDERRAQLYVANFTGRRIDVISTSDRSLQNSIPVDGEPGSLALSPDGRYLLVTNYDNLGDPAPQLTILDLDGNVRNVVAIPPGPVSTAPVAKGCPTTPVP